MDDHSCDLGTVPAVASDGTGTSSAVAGGTDISPGKQSALDGASLQEENADGSLEAGVCTVFSKSAGSGMKKDLQKCATFPSSAAEAGQEDSCCDADDAPKDAHTYQRSASLPPTVKLIPAIKGSRQKNGIPLPAEDRHIKWAADVYDPPVSSVSHSVNNSYQRRPKPRKKDKTKQKEKRKARNKKKTSNAAQNQAVLQTPELEDLGTSIGREAPADPGKLETEMLDYGISSQEAKCGSSFLLETAAKMHFSTAEAS
ncbi:uncharacterized protein [Aegilops tauschii subsp. strangulata]|uniref:Uncharacterized protein n=3 Tax=Aegilops tauschii TaxID=37682 RepID=A0A452XNS3_AEGTS|nr:uncharacterized protein LOC109758782 [Aegilops tauschii subsp. strangulata]